MLRSVRILSFLLISFATVGANVLGGNVLCQKGDHLAVEAPHAQSGCRATRSLSCHAAADVDEPKNHTDRHDDGPALVGESGCTDLSAALGDSNPSLRRSLLPDHDLTPLFQAPIPDLAPSALTTPHEAVTVSAWSPPDLTRHVIFLN